MSGSWHNFFFGAFDPWGTVSVDKLPGAFWIQALSLRVFGFHVWAIVLPQVVEGTLTVLVLYRAVRRVAGAGAGLVAAVALAVTPVTVLLNRGNISDSLLILLLVLAADAATAAYMSGRLRPLVLAGLWVGLAFQAKMLQAWLVLPAIYMAYLLAAPALSLARRYGHIAVSAAVALAVSISWMTIVTVVPAPDRPYVDGNCNNSVFSQVFLYNGADRLSGRVLDQPGCTPPPVSVQATTAGGAPTHALDKGPARFLAGSLGRDAAWLFIPAVVALGGILVARRRRPRTDPWRAAAVLWGLWMVLTWGFFASSHFLNAYYLAALTPPMAALCGLGLALAWRMRTESRLVPATVLVAVVAGAAQALALIPRGAGVWPWVVATTLVVTGAAVVAAACGLLRSPPKWAARAGLGFGAAALLIGAAWASGTSVAQGLGPFDTPYQPAGLTTTAARAMAARGRRLVRPGGRRGQGSGVAQHRDSRDLSPSQPGRLGHRPRVPPGGRLHRPGSEHVAGPVRTRRTGWAHRARARRRQSADAQSGHALGTRPLPGHHRLVRHGTDKRSELRPLRLRSPRRRLNRHRIAIVSISARLRRRRRCRCAVPRRRQVPERFEDGRDLSRARRSEIPRHKRP